MPRLTPAEIEARYNNINNIYQEYSQRIENIRGQERQILSDFIKQLELEKVADIRRSIQQEYQS